MPSFAGWLFYHLFLSLGERHRRALSLGGVFIHRAAHSLVSCCAECIRETILARHVVDLEQFMRSHLREIFFQKPIDAYVVHKTYVSTTYLFHW